MARGRPDRIASPTASTASCMPGKAKGSVRRSRRGSRNSRASSGVVTPRRRRIAATRGWTPRAAARERASGSGGGLRQGSCRTPVTGTILRSSGARPPPILRALPPCAHGSLAHGGNTAPPRLQVYQTDVRVNRERVLDLVLDGIRAAGQERPRVSSPGRGEGGDPGGGAACPWDGPASRALRRVSR